MGAPQTWEILAGRGDVDPLAFHYPQTPSVFLRNVWVEVTITGVDHRTLYSLSPLTSFVAQKSENGLRAKPPHLLGRFLDCPWPPKRPIRPIVRSNFGLASPRQGFAATTPGATRRGRHQKSAPETNAKAISLLARGNVLGCARQFTAIWLAASAQ